MKAVPMQTAKLALPVAIILVGGLLFAEALPRTYLGGIITSLLGLIIVSSFTIEYERFANAKAPLSRGQRAFFVICGATMTLSGALMIWERL